MKKPLLAITILSAVLLAVGTVIYFLFLCPTCQATGEENSIKATPLFLDVNSSQDKEEDERIGSAAPFFVLENSTGQELSLGNFRGKNVLLVFWATSCGWCEKERPDLNKFTQEQKNKIEVLAIAWESKETLESYVKQKQINFTILSDPERKTQAKYLALGTPSHFLIDKQGEIAAIRPGYASYKDLLELIKVLE